MYLHNVYEVYPFNNIVSQAPFPGVELEHKKLVYIENVVVLYESFHIKIESR